LRREAPVEGKKVEFAASRSNLDLDLMAQPPDCFARQVFAAALRIRACRGSSEVHELLDDLVFIALSARADRVVEPTSVLPFVVKVHRERGQEAPRSCEECRVVV
jgi:hypothetical protein